MEKSNRRWVRGSCIGRGANGTVNLALNLSTGDVFAVKSVEFGGSSTASQLRALENEIEILKSLSYPYIVRYLGDDETAPFRNLHVEYMPRGTAADSPTSDEETVRIRTRCLVSALSYLHSNGVVHCDVKGKNVLLGPTSGAAKLADFGSAARISEGRISPRGSPLWMAPEVVRGEYQGPESDVWSLGCTVIEMMTGKPAWDSVSRLGYSAEPPALPGKISDLGRDFLSKCMCRDAQKRWSCDRLLQHPFVAQCSLLECPIIGDSPRCVLDLVDSDFDDEEIDRTEEEGEDLDLKAKGRIRGLVCGTGANWESNGWVEVRGASSEYVYLSTAKGESSSLDGSNPEEAEEDGIQYDVVDTGTDKCELVGDSKCIASLNMREKNLLDGCYTLSLLHLYIIVFGLYILIILRLFELIILLQIIFHKVFLTQTCPISASKFPLLRLYTSTDYFC